jgi:hypothetical protein
MMNSKWVLACVLSLGLGSSSLLAKDDASLKFDGGIGVIPVSNVTVVAGVVTVSPNAVRGVNPPGQIWVIDALKAEVRGDEIRVRGRGLLLGGGSNVGKNAGASVIATLACGQAPTFTLHSTPTTRAVPLDANGNFRIDDVLTPAPPMECLNPVLLIRSAGGANPWFAAGIVKQDDDDN